MHRPTVAVLSAALLKNVNAKVATPDWMKQRLERSGIRSISALVDIGNYVMLEIGQPMHVFDADKLSGSLIVRVLKMARLWRV